MWCKTIKCKVFRNNDKTTQIYPNFSVYKDDEYNEKRDIDSYSINNPELNARSFQDAQINKGRFGYIRDSLTTIEFNSCSVDLLHLFLRITDQLQKLLRNQIDSFGKYSFLK